MTPLLAQFIQETRELLEQASSGLIALEKNPSDRGLINQVFRSVHTIKGASGLFDFHPLIALLHAGEDLLDQVRGESLSITHEIIDSLLEALDQVASWLDDIEAHEALPETAERNASRFVRQLRGFLQPDEIVESEQVTAADTMSLDWLMKFPESVRLQAFETLEDGESALTGLVYTPDSGCFYKGQDPLYLTRQVTDLHGLVIEGPEPAPGLDGYDAYNCGLRFYLLTTVPRPQIEEVFRYVAQETVIVDVQPTQLGLPGRDGDKCAVNGDSIGEVSAPSTNGHEESAFRHILTEQLRVLDTPTDPAQWNGRLRAVIQTVKNCLRALGRDEPFAELDGALSQTEQLRSLKPVQEVLQGIIGTIGTAGDGLSPVALVEEVTEIQEGVEEARSAPDRTPQGSAKVLKIDQARIDKLMDLIGEMVVAKNSLPYLAKRAESVFGVRELSREIKDKYAVIDRISQEMQSAIMQVRMLPVSNIFQRFPRLVRDIARKLGKRIALRISGEETEADKNIIEMLSEPLIHMVRNSIDHGIEMPELREELGKPAEGTISINAFYESDSVIIEIADDGKGIDPQVIKLKAYQKGLLSEERLAVISDEEALQLVFAPGLSTAESISDLSGRGVGMDVVRSTIEHIGGSVALSSKKGAGTTVRIRLPLSMAVTQVMGVEVAGQLWGIPMDLVAETVRIPSLAVFRIKNRDVFVLRNRIVPLTRLTDLLALSRTDQDLTHNQLAIIVVRINGEHIGIVVDRFWESMEIIIKPMEGILGGLTSCYSGTGLLGDGTILMVLNIKELLYAH